MKKKILIEGMSCSHCVAHVKEALQELKGMKSIDVDLSSKIALVETDGEIKDESIKEAIEDFGYEVVKIETL
ncbi:heavy-metal-associated domain-containing protein [Clostridium niameyense]|uniref:Copper chaperone CopZ n=1 Tax=Clostridium niameyense TaxID=1622073 RepID=A0A6M0R6L8_9CLOT|nr:heavy metal-associated domain-containing protein [Clostridium niameyense]NEZ45836.1 heavy-metal-associated domain-containing protein [Clostridium niameyense]